MFPLPSGKPLNVRDVHDSDSSHQSVDVMYDFFETQTRYLHMLGCTVGLAILHCRKVKTC